MVIPPLHPDVPHLYRGKTRDTYALPNPELLLVVASDRLSTHNIVHESTVPGKGEVLTALSVFWFKHVLGQIGRAHV